MRLPFILALLAGISATPARAQDQDSQLWVKLAASVDLVDDVALRLEMNQRISDDRDGLFESQYLAALAFKLANGVTLTGGLNRVVGLSGGRVASTEWRPRQQISFPISKIGPGKLVGRVRLEQRFRSNSGDVGHRVRPEISFALPLRKSLDLQLAHEDYFNLNDTDFGQNAGHERMRNSATLVVALSKTLKAEVGYMNQYRFNEDRRDLIEHALTTGLTANF